MENFRKILFLFFLLPLLLSCTKGSTTTTTTLPEVILYPWVNDLNLRSEPDPDLTAFTTLTQGEALTYFGEESTNFATFNLRGNTFTTNFIKIQREDGTEGWVYAAAVSTNPAASYEIYYYNPLTAEVPCGSVETEFGVVETNCYGEYLIEDWGTFFSLFTNALYSEDFDELKKFCFGDIGYHIHFYSRAISHSDDFLKPHLMDLDLEMVKKVIELGSIGDIETYDSVVIYKALRKDESNWVVYDGNEEDYYSGNVFYLYFSRSGNYWELYSVHDSYSID